MGLPRTLPTLLTLVLCSMAVLGCGTTRLTDTTRSASEEMLLSHSIDRSVGKLGLEVLAGQAVYLDVSHLGDVQYRGYLTGALRQHLLANGARLVSDPEQAGVVVEARAGSVATARHDSLVGVPQTTMPTPLLGVPFTIPELAIVKKATHIGVTKVGVFAYRTDNGAGIWQSGMHQSQSVSHSRWYMGVGPFLTGDIVLDGYPQPGDEFGGTRSGASQPSPLECESWIGEASFDGLLPAPSTKLTEHDFDQEAVGESPEPGEESSTAGRSGWQLLPPPVVMGTRPIPLARPPAPIPAPLPAGDQ